MSFEALLEGSLSSRAAAPGEAGRVKVIVIGTIALGGLLVYWFARPRTVPMPTPDKEVTIESPQLPEPPALESAEPDPVADAKNISSDASMIEPADPRPASSEKLEESRHRFARIERRFEIQDVEPGRSDGFRDFLVTGFRDSGLHDIVELVAADCRRTLCAIDLRYRSGGELGDKIARVINEWLRGFPDCNYHVPGELLLSPSEYGDVSQRLWVECHQF